MQANLKEETKKNEEDGEKRNEKIEEEKGKMTFPYLHNLGKNTTGNLVLPLSLLSNVLMLH
jgi:glutaredoxin